MVILINGKLYKYFLSFDYYGKENRILKRGGCGEK